ncbi:hypothetical protein OV079_12300 [Nannocystis pusilla]|uniref:Uncharacterized protein n=1 Tax=Nannocystis pusilla TaxID=889268 RepID=A0A9X3IVI8_9BACT|nr:hypothetical protein [Nannocystis pusilla]MCY1006327.1 hypothetical protein [Nannocystis pusilla]
MADATGPRDPVLLARAQTTGAPLALAGPDASDVDAWSDLAERFDGAINAWDLGDAADAVAAMPPGSARDVKAGVLAFHRAAYPEAESLLAGAVASGQLPPAGRCARRPSTTSTSRAGPSGRSARPRGSPAPTDRSRSCSPTPRTS